MPARIGEARRGSESVHDPEEAEQRRLESGARPA
jgi:hypothetical protein